MLSKKSKIDSRLPEMNPILKQAWMSLTQPLAQRIFTDLDDAQAYADEHPGVQVQVKLTEPVTFDSFENPTEAPNV